MSKKYKKISYIVIIILIMIGILYGSFFKKSFSQEEAFKTNDCLNPLARQRCNEINMELVRVWSDPPSSSEEFVLDYYQCKNPEIREDFKFTFEERVNCGAWFEENL